MKTKSTKQAEALQRQKAFDALTPHQRLQKLVENGHGNCKEADKYRAQIGQISEKAAEKTKKVVKKTRKMRKRERKAAKK